MKTKETLPDGYSIPGWVGFFSYVFLFFLLMPIGLVTFMISGQNPCITAFGLKVYAQQDFVLYAFLVLLPFFGGLAAVGILLRKAWGLILGLGYSSVAIVVCCVSFFLNYGSKLGDHSPYVEFVLLLLFLRWLVTTIKRSDKILQATAASPSS